jgi:hypothetical protein
MFYGTVPFAAACMPAVSKRIGVEIKCPSYTLLGLGYV